MKYGTIYINIYPLPINYRPQEEIINSNGTKMIMYVYNKLYLHNIISVLVNFSASSYRAEVDATSVIVHVIVFGSIFHPFTVQVIPKTIDTPNGNYNVTAFWNSINFSGDQLFFNDDPKDVLIPLLVNAALVSIQLFPEELEDMDLRFNLTLVVPPNAMSLGVILSEPSMATVTVPINRGEYVFTIVIMYIAV